jgi:hypothetical protein
VIVSLVLPAGGMDRGVNCYAEALAEVGGKLPNCGAHLLAACLVREGDRQGPGSGRILPTLGSFGCGPKLLPRPGPADEEAVDDSALAAEVMDQSGPLVPDARRRLVGCGCGCRPPATPGDGLDGEVEHRAGSRAGVGSWAGVGSLSPPWAGGGARPLTSTYWCKVNGLVRLFFLTEKKDSP